MKVTKVEHARKDYPEHGIKKGDTYYWWQFAFSPKQFSKTPPRRSQLTKSSFLASLYDLQDSIAAMKASDLDELESALEDVKNEVQNLLDETQDSYDNMPEQLKESSSSGELLQERIDELESWISELDCIDISFDADESASKTEQAEALQEYIDSVIEEIQQTGGL